MKIPKKIIAMYAATHLLISGCTTAIGRYPQKTEVEPAYRIEFIYSEPQTLDELIDATKDIGEGIEYLQRFNDIKDNIQTNPGYKPHKDIRTLVYQIESSDMKNKDSVSEQIKSFSYYRYDRTEIAARGPLPKKTYSFGGGSLIAFGGYNMLSGDAAIGLLCVVGGTITYFMSVSEDVCPKRYETQKVLISPYHDSE